MQAHILDSVLIDIQNDLASVSPKQASPAKSELEVIAGYEVHPLASIWPLVEGGETHKELESSIRSLGVINHIVKDSKTGQVIDGRNRLQVYDRIAAGDPEWAKAHPLPIKELAFASDEEVWEHIKAMNKARRHMTDDQLVAIAVMAGQYLERTKAAQAKTQFKKGKKTKVTGVVSEVTMPDGSPLPKKKKTAGEYHQTSAGGLIAKDAGVGLHKGRQGATVAKGIAKGVVSKDDLKPVAEGKKALNEVVKKVEAAIPPKRKEKPEADKGLSAPKVFRASPTLTLQDVEEWIKKNATQDEMNRLYDLLKNFV